MTCHLQCRRPDDTRWTTVLTSEANDRRRLAAASKRYHQIYADHMGTTDTKWRVVDDEHLELERLPLLQHESSGPLVFLALVVFVSAVALFGLIVSTGIAP